MSNKKKSKDSELKYLCGQLSMSYARWKHIYEFGCSDPCWSDGCNINLVRNHIFYYKSELERMLGNKCDVYPEEYYFPEPPEMSNDFMAVDRKMYSYQTEDNPTGLVAKNKTMCYNDIMKKFEYSDMALF